MYIMKYCKFIYIMKYCKYIHIKFKSFINNSYLKVFLQFKNVNFTFVIKQRTMKNSENINLHNMYMLYIILLTCKFNKESIYFVFKIKIKEIFNS